MFGAGLPRVLAAPLIGMTISYALPWAHHIHGVRGNVVAALLGIAVFGLLLAFPLELKD